MFFGIGSPNERQGHKRYCSLILFNAKFTDDDSEEICALPHLTRLDLLGRTTISDASLRHLTGLHSLESLNLQSAGPVTDDTLKYIADLRRLTDLNLSQTTLSDDGLVHLAGLRQLENLNLSQTKVSGEMSKLTVINEVDRMFASAETH